VVARSIDDVLGLYERWGSYRGAVDLRHEVVGARHLSGLFGSAVTRPIALHVSAKRYRCAVEPDFLLGLSSPAPREGLLGFP
jgi:predicted HD phosphohydrolase